MTWYSTIISIGPILQGAMKVPMIFLEVLSYALTVKEEGVMVFMFKPMARVVVKGQTFIADSLSISTMGTLAPMHSIVICKGLIWVAHSGRESSLEKARRGSEAPSTPMRDSTSWGVVSMGTSFPFKAPMRALRYFWDAMSKPYTDTWAWVFFNCVKTLSSSSLFSFPFGSIGLDPSPISLPG